MKILDDLAWEMLAWLIRRAPTQSGVAARWAEGGGEGWRDANTAARWSMVQVQWKLLNDWPKSPSKIDLDIANLVWVP